MQKNYKTLRKKKYLFPQKTKDGKKENPQTFKSEGKKPFFSCSCFLFHLQLGLASGDGADDDFRGIFIDDIGLVEEVELWWGD